MKSHLKHLLQKEAWIFSVCWEKSWNSVDLINLSSCHQSDALWV